MGNKEVYKALVYTAYTYMALHKAEDYTEKLLLPSDYSELGILLHPPYLDQIVLNDS
jgi:hypothetical protein